MTDPMVMEWVLANHDDYFSGSSGFFDGVISAVVMRYDHYTGRTANPAVHESQAKSG